MQINVNSLSVTVTGLDNNADFRNRIARTLALCPSRHVTLIHHISIRDRADYEGGSTNPVSRGDRSAGYWIMLDIDSFDPRLRPINNRAPDFYHYTILHELGHVVDYSFRGMRWVRRNERAGYRAMMGHAHRGETPGASEHYADTYADFFFYRESQRPLDARMRALVASPPFDGISTTRRH